MALKVLIACEESQVVCKAFRALGHEEYSCDLQECSGGHPEWHIQDDMFNHLHRGWDFIGLHPDCRKLTTTGNRTYAAGMPKHKERIEAIEWTVELWQKAIKAAPFVYLENPKGVLNTDSRMPKPQIIQPWYFGDSFQKQTCLWLHNLPFLIHHANDNLFGDKTHVPAGEFYYTPKGVRMPKWYADTSTSGGNEKNRAIRSKTFPGIAQAMAEQWSTYILNKQMKAA